ncbi:hypothetical protein GCM10023116_37320 [Kistimonas scapharcae]|uniref:Uncharacterized protein n=1 Tax=Kistimonas scapharcae TaxID=1036133 RepID=A0ABP8V5B1_9GAMM
MADDGGWPDSEYSARIPDSRAIHRHILDPFVFVSVIDEIELKAVFAVSAEIALRSGVRFTVIHNTINVLTAGAYNVNDSHNPKMRSRTIVGHCYIYGINGSDSSPHHRAS